MNKTDSNEIVKAIEYFREVSGESHLIYEEVSKYVQDIESILDVGSGPGYISRALCRDYNDCQIVFIDPWWSIEVDPIRESYINLKWEDYSPSNTFSHILFSHVIVWFDIDNRIDEVIRSLPYLMKDGTLIIIENAQSGQFSGWYKRVCSQFSDFSWEPSGPKLIEALSKNNCEVESHSFSLDLSILNNDPRTKRKIADIFFPFKIDSIIGARQIRDSFLEINSIDEVIILAEKNI